jgi:uncharacterized protein YjbJ (UPF0337 family)
MNNDIALGHIKTLVGACQHALASAVGNRTLAEAGQRRYCAGKGQVSVGKAQQLIKQCIARMQTR